MKNPIYKWIRRKQDRLKRRTDRRHEGIWMAPPPRLLQTGELQEGDVLFCGQTMREKLTNAIQNTTDGVYVHCGIYIGDGTVIDAVRPSVRSIPLTDFVQCYAYIAVTRTPGSCVERSSSVVRFAKSCAEKRLPYNKLGAILVPLREYRNTRNQYRILLGKKFRPAKENSARFERGFFCSELVVRCYQECDYIPRYLGYYQPNRWSPTGLAEENIFQLVGYLSSGGLMAVAPQDPFIRGHAWVLTPEGQRKLNIQQKELEARAKAIIDKLRQTRQ